MDKRVFSIECEINASPKILYHYINTAAGLKKWFADNVIEQENDFIFFWDKSKYEAKKVEKKENHFVKFDFKYDEEENENSSIILKLEPNELTNTTFVIIEDHSQSDVDEDLKEMYEHSLITLKEIVGGRVS